MIDIKSYTAIQNFWELKDDSFFPFDKETEEKNPFFKDEIVKRRVKYEISKGIVSELSIETINECKKNLIKSITKAIELLSAEHKFKLSPNQGTIIDNLIFGKTLEIIKSSLTSVLGFGYSDFFYEEKSKFNPDNLIKCLKRNLILIKETEIKSYSELVSFYEDIEKQIIELWGEEDTRITIN